MKILVVGDAIVDEYVYGEINRMSPEDETVPVVDMFDGVSQFLGGCLNVAGNVRSLGCDVSVSTILDLSIANWVAATKIDTRFTSRGSTLVKRRIINRKTNRQVARLDYVKRFPFQEVEEYKKFIKQRDFLSEFDGVIVSDYGKGVVDEFWVDILSNFKKPVFIDTKNPNLAMWNKVPNAFFKLNHKEYFSAKSEASHPLIVTHGDKGAYFLRQGTQEFAIPAKEVANPDPVGAGDVFVAALAVKYLETQDIRQAMEFANRVAAISCGKPGTATVQKEEVDQEEHWDRLEDRY